MILPYLVLFIIAAYMMNGAWRKPDEFRKKNYMPWMDSYWGWNSYRLAITVFFIILVFFGVAILAKFLQEIVAIVVEFLK